MHSFVKKAWLSYVDGKSFSLCMPGKHRWKEADVAHFQVLPYYILRQTAEIYEYVTTEIYELKFQCRTLWIHSRVLPTLLRCLVDTCCKFTSWNYWESVISSLLYQMFLPSITVDNWQYTVQRKLQECLLRNFVFEKARKTWCALQNLGFSFPLQLYFLKHSNT